MNTFLKIAGVVAAFVAVVAFAGVATTYAQGPGQPDDVTPRGGYQGQNDANPGVGLMAVDEATMHAAIADALGLSLEDFEAAIAEGKTPFILAQELNIDFAEVTAAMDAVHADALDQAVADGLITQEQADWILSHRGGQNGQGNNLNRGLNNSPMGGMGRGAGGNGSGTGDCIYQTS